MKPSLIQKTQHIVDDIVDDKIIYSLLRALTAAKRSYRELVGGFSSSNNFQSPHIVCDQALVDVSPYYASDNKDYQQNFYKKSGCSLFIHYIGYLFFNQVRSCDSSHLCGLLSWVGGIFARTFIRGKEKGDRLQPSPSIHCLHKTVYI